MSQSPLEPEPLQPFSCGCLIAAIVMTPVFVILTMAEVLGDCLPDYPCSKNFPLHVLLPCLLIGVGVILLAGGLIKLWRKYRNGRR